MKIYGISASRTLRPLWLLEEIGMEYEQIVVDIYQGDQKKPEYLAINPNGKVPAMVDDGLVLHESMAINLYIAKKYGAALFPDDDADIARTLMWSFWVVNEIEHDLLQVLFHKRTLPEPKREPERAERALRRLRSPFGILDQALEGREYLVKDTFTVADLNVAAVMSWARPCRLDLAEWPAMQEWLLRCIKRPAFKTAIRKP